MDDEAYQRKVEAGFNKILNSHGYGFHYAVLKRAAELYSEGKSTWKFEVAEFPVEIQGTPTRIDFILRRRYGLPFYLIAECKRANPALSNWCFVRAPYTRRNQGLEGFTYERVKIGEKRILLAYAQKHAVHDGPYHIGLEVKSNEKGDSIGSGRGMIEEASTQISRGLNGMVRFLSSSPQMLSAEQDASFIPVIFTTAQLWVSDIDLSSADLQTGNINITEESFNRKKWLLYQYHLSPGLKHSFARTDEPSDLIGLMEHQYVRTIGIVSPSGIEEFLGWASELDL